MAQITLEVKKLIRQYINKLEDNNIHIIQAILFGSYARGTQQEWSDIDLALISDVFEGSRILDRSKIRRITLSVSSSLEPIPFRPEDFNQSDPFVKEILEQGIKIL